MHAARCSLVMSGPCCEIANQRKLRLLPAAMSVLAHRLNNNPLSSGRGVVSNRYNGGGTINSTACEQHLPECAGGVPGGPNNPLGAHRLSLYQGSRDTMFRIHGTNEPRLIDTAVSKGCIHLTNDDIIDLYNRSPLGGWCWSIDWAVTCGMQSQGGRCMPCKGGLPSEGLARNPLRTLDLLVTGSQARALAALLATG